MKLLPLVRSALRLRHYSGRTEEAYVRWIYRFIRFHGLRHPREMGSAEVSAFLASLAVQGRVSASTQNQALAALLFLYGEVLGHQVAWVANLVRAKNPPRIPVVLTRDEVRAILGRMRGVPQLVARLLYGTGVRLLEGLSLRVKDVDFEMNEITVRRGKGDRDRITMLPASLKPALTVHVQVVHLLHDRRVAAGAGWVELPGALDKKYPPPGASGAGSGCSRPPGTASTPPPGRLGAIISTRPSSSGRSGMRSRRAASPNRPTAIPSGTPSPPTFWNPATTSEPSRNCSDIGT